MLKSIFSLCMLIGISFSCSNTNQKKNVNAHDVEYFAQLAGIISPYLEYKGRGEIGSNSAKNQKHYLFTYTENGEIRSIKFYDKDMPSSDSYFGTHEVTYSYTQDKLERTYWNENGSKSNMWRHYYFGENIHKEKFELDQNGQKQSLVLFDSMETQVSSGLGTYRFEFESIDENSFIQRQFNERGEPVTLTTYFPFLTSLISIDQRGYLETISNLDVNEKIVNSTDAGYAKVLFNFDEFGNELGWSFHDEKDELANRKPLNEMDYDFAKVVYSFDWIDRKVGTYSSFKESYFDWMETPTLTNQGVHTNLYTFNASDQLLSVSYYGIGNEAIEHPTLGYHIIQYEYDQNGNGKLKNKLDENGIPIPN